MPLNRRQRRSYHDTVSIYKKALLPVTVSPTDKRAVDATIPVNPTYVHVPCMYVPTPETDAPEPGLGRTKATNLFTLDKWEFAEDTDIVDGDLVKFTTPGSQFAGSFWQVEGNPYVIENKGRMRPNCLTVYLKHGAKPRGVV